MLKARPKLLRDIFTMFVFAIIIIVPSSYLPTFSPPTTSASTSAMPMPLECFAVADSVDQLVSMDRFTGAFTDYGATGTTQIEAIAVSLDSNTLYAANAGQFGTLNMTTGVFTAIGAGIGTGNNVDSALGMQAFNDVDSLSFDAATGVLWGVVQTPNLIFAINPATGTFIPNVFGTGRDYAELDLSTIPTGPTDTDDMGIHPITGEFYVIANGNAPPNADRVVQVNINPVNPDLSPGYNAANGQISVTDIAPLTNAGNPIRDMEGFSFFNDGTFYGTTGAASGGGNNDSLWQIDLTGTPGAATLVGAFPSHGDYESVGCLTAGSNTLSGTVFCEPAATANGVFDGTDTAQTGAVVRLYRDNGTTPNQVDGGDTLIQTFTTGAGGTYDFEMGIAGNFVVDIDPAIIPGGSVYTVPVTPGNDQDVDFLNTGPQFSEFGNNDPGNDFGFICAAAAASDLTVAKSDAPDPITPGNNLTYTIGVTNLGPNAAVNGTLSDPLPAGTTFVSLTPAAGWTCTTPAVGSGGTINCSNPSVAVGGPYTFTLVVNVPAGYTTPNPIPNTATVGADNDSNSTNNTASTTTALLLASPSDLTVAKSDAPDPITPGNNLTYTIGVTNLGPNAAVNGTLSDPLPAGTTFVSHTPAAGWTCTTPAVGSGGTYNCSNPSVAVGGPYTFILTVNVPAGYTTPNPIPNTATVGADNDSNSTNNTATTTTALVVAVGPDVAITKVDSNDPVPVGDTFTYTIVVTNIGTVAQTNTTVTDTLPAGVSYISDDAGCVVALPTLTCNLGTLNPAASATINITVSADTPGTVLNVANVSGDLPETNTANNTDDEPTTITTGGLVMFFDPAISKIGILEPGGLGLTGEQITWVITITNIGTAPGTNVVITDVMRPELRVDGLEIDDGIAAIDGQTITFIIPSLDPGEVVVARIFTTVLRSPSDGVIDNSAVLTAGDIRLVATAVVPVPTGLPNTGYPPSERGR